MWSAKNSEWLYYSSLMNVWERGCVSFRHERPEKDLQKCVLINVSPSKEEAKSIWGNLCHFMVSLAILFNTFLLSFTWYAHLSWTSNNLFCSFSCLLFFHRYCRFFVIDLFLVITLYCIQLNTVPSQEYRLMSRKRNRMTLWIKEDKSRGHSWLGHPLKHFSADQVNIRSSV